MERSCLHPLLLSRLLRACLLFGQGPAPGKGPLLLLLSSSLQPRLPPYRPLTYTSRVHEPALQNLVNTPPLRDSLLARGRDGLAGEGDVTRALRAVMAAVWSSSSTALVPQELLDAVAKAEPRFEGYRQHDSHELFQALLEAVRVEESKRRLPSAPTVPVGDGRGRTDTERGQTGK